MIEEVEDLANLKSKLFIRSPNGTKLDYECIINGKEEDRVTEGTFLIHKPSNTKYLKQQAIYFLIDICKFQILYGVINFGQ